MRNALVISTLLSSAMIMNAYATPIAAPPATTTSANVSAALSQTQPPVENVSKAQANVSLEQEGQRLYAHVVIEQPENTNGKVRIDWMPPVHSSCDKSSYFLTYQGKRFHTQAYRTLGYGLISGKSVTCTGTWHATVVDEQGKTLATTSITIESVDSYATNNAEKMRSLAAIA